MRLAGGDDRALRHHLDQVGAVGGRAMDIRQQTVSGNPDAVERARRPIGLQRRLDRGTRMTQLEDAPVAATRTSPDLVFTTNTPVSANREAGWRIFE